MSASRRQSRCTGYVTAWATGDGIVQLGEDIYNRDGLGAYAARADAVVPRGAR
jgi:murein L,D-transpeptidase YcbB/YkuD